MKKKLLKLSFLLIILLCAVSFPTAETAAKKEKPDFKVIIGEWVRPDGGYIVRVRAVKSDGSVDVGYFNPNKINIAEANVSLWKGLIKLFIYIYDVSLEKLHNHFKGWSAPSIFYVSYVGVGDS